MRGAREGGVNGVGAVVGGGATTPSLGVPGWRRTACFFRLGPQTRCNSRILLYIEENCLTTATNPVCRATAALCAAPCYVHRNPEDEAVDDDAEAAAMEGADEVRLPGRGGVRSSRTVLVSVVCPCCLWPRCCTSGQGFAHRWLV